MKAPSRKKDVAAPESDRLREAPTPRATQVLFGQDAAEQALLNAYRGGRFPHAWLVSGRVGVGKATLCWRMARFMTAHPDPTQEIVLSAQNLWVDPESAPARQIASLSAPDVVLARREWNEKTTRFFSEIRVDDVRHAIDRFHMRAADSGWRICIIDCADELNKSGANALLKMIEEPPERSAFFIVAHQPGRTLPTIRSRCRALKLEPLNPEDLQRAIRAAGGIFETAEARKITEAIAKANGSTRAAMMRLTRADALAPIENFLGRLPNVDWLRARELAEAAGKAENEQLYDATLETIFAWLNERVRTRAGKGPRAIALYANAWEKITEQARTIEVYNLDKRAFLMGAFEDLRAAEAGDFEALG